MHADLIQSAARSMDVLLLCTECVCVSLCLCMCVLKKKLLPAATNLGPRIVSGSKRGHGVCQTSHPHRKTIRRSCEKMHPILKSGLLLGDLDPSMGTFRARFSMGRTTDICHLSVADNRAVCNVLQHFWDDSDDESSAETCGLFRGH